MEYSYLRPVPKMASDDAQTFHWIQAYPFGEWADPTGNVHTITPEKCTLMLNNFKNNVRGHEIATDYDHRKDVSKGNKASGWVRDMMLKDDGLWWLMEWTPTAKQEIQAGEWKYFSPEWVDEWEHPATHETHYQVVLGGGLTNRPLHKGRLPINASELTLETDMGLKDVLTGKTPADPPQDDPKDEGGDTLDPSNQPLDPDLERANPKHKEPGTVGDDKVPEKVPETAKGADVVELKTLREKLGLPEDADEDTIVAEIVQMKAEVTPLRNVAHEQDKKANFASEYPAEHSRLVALEQESRQSRASEFAAKFTDLGDGKGLSKVARDKIETAYLASENNSLTASDLTETLNTILGKDAVVDFTEHGTNHEGDSDALDSDPRMAYAMRVKALQASENISYTEAANMAAEQHPDEYAAYRTSVGTNGSGE